MSFEALKTVILRTEYRTEQRTILTPENASTLIACNVIVLVESSKDRVYTDVQYKDAGCIIVPPGTWRDLPVYQTLVLGLKELPDTITNVQHNMVHFQHCLAGQKGSNVALNNLRNGCLYDLEYFINDQGIRLFSFGRYAGFVGAALGIKKWISKQLNTDFYTNYQSKYTANQLSTQIKTEFINSKLCQPHVLIIGANGKCGRGAIDLLDKASITNVTKWDLADTKGKNGPFDKILDFDIFINCVAINHSGIPNPSLTLNSLKRNRNLSVIVDVSCDVHSTYNAIPFNTRTTSLDKPFYDFSYITELGDEKSLALCSVDNLPSLVPKDASDEFSKSFFEILLEFDKGSWIYARRRFMEKVYTIPKHIVTNIVPPLAELVTDKWTVNLASEQTKQSLFQITDPIIQVESIIEQTTVTPTEATTEIVNVIHSNNVSESTTLLEVGEVIETTDEQLLQEHEYEHNIDFPTKVIDADTFSETESREVTTIEPSV